MSEARRWGARRRQRQPTRRRSIATEMRQQIAEDFGADIAEWWHPAFEPHDSRWTAEACERQSDAFERGYAELRRFPRGMSGEQYPRPTLGEVGAALPYAVDRQEARALARILLGLRDPRTPRDVRTALGVHVRDIVRADGLLYEARPSKLPARPTPKVPAAVREAFQGPRGRSLRRELRRACRRRDADEVLEVLKRHRLKLHDEQWLRDSVEMKGLAVAVVEALDPAISKASAKRLLYDR